MRLEVDIRKNFGSFVLESRFVTEEGVLAILGASGSGKTMTLKCIAGVETPDEGRIVLGDRVLFDSEKRINLPARKRNVGFLFQDYALFPNMTVRQNVAGTARDAGKVDAMLERFGLGSVRDLYPDQLSGGQSQRTAIARMLLAEPEVILLDEPFSALDNYLQFRMEQEILEVIEAFEGPVILVSHDRNEVYRMADHIGVMDGGKLIHVQDKEAFFDSPRTVAATRLTGCKNISAVKRIKDDLYAAVDWGISIRLPDLGEDGIRYVGYRAHYFELTDRDEGVNVFRCSVCRIIEDTFSVMVCFRQMDHQGQSPDAVLTWVVPRAKWSELKEKILGEPFYLRLDPARLIMLEG